MRILMAPMVFCAALASPVDAGKQEPQAVFALVVGVNQGVDADLEPLAYADDDATRTFDLFRALGASVTLLADPDKNTRRLHHQAVAEARPPTGQALAAAVATIAGRIQQARRYGIPSTFYFVYAGHGNETEDGRGYLTLADERLTLDALRSEVLAAIGADATHVIVDACYADFLVRTRGPGGERRAVRGFSRAGGLAEEPAIGLLLASSKGQESHEWEAIQAGVFSHEVRSGLFGAADADSDGIVTYREIAAFVERANAAIPNERYRPRVFARPPAGGEALVDLRRVLKRRLEVPGDEPAHYYLEDTLGVRLADFHNDTEQAVHIIRPRQAGLLYLRRPVDEREFALDPHPGVIRLAELAPSAPRSRARGAAHHAFKLLFMLPFGIQQVGEYALTATAPELGTGSTVTPGKQDWIEPAGWTAVGIAGASLAAAAGLSFSSLALRDRADADTSQREIIRLNAQIADRNRIAVGLYAVAGATAAAGLIMLLWPDSPALPSIHVAGHSASAGIVWRFR